MRAARGEWGRIARLQALFDAGVRAEGVEVAIGDDAAVLAPTLAKTVWSVDAHVETVHFERAWLSLREIGWRAVTAALSDLAAMGAEPHAILWSVAVPSYVDDDGLDALALGARDAADVARARVVGGNLTRASELALHTTVGGRTMESPLLRRGARPGDAVYVTGTVGAAALGLRSLSLGDGRPELTPFVARWRRPQARLVEGRRLVGLASAAIDVSDGLAQDLGHIATASGVQIRIDAAALPFEASFVSACRLLEVDPLSLALFGGEDYEVAFTAPLSVDASRVATCIGRVVAGEGVRLVRDDGREEELSSVGGFDHFAGGSP